MSESLIHPRPGDRVVSSSDLPVGTIKSARKNHIEIGKARFWLPESAVIERGDRVVRLDEEYDFLVAPEAVKSGGGLRKFLGLLTLGGAIMAAVLAFQKKRRSNSRPRTDAPFTPPISPQSRSEFHQTSSNGAAAASTASATPTLPRPDVAAASMPPFTPVAATPAESASIPSEELGAQKGSLTTAEALDISPAGDELPPFAALDLSDRVVTATEEEVIALVSRAFPARTIQVSAIGVHKLDGDKVGTLRFTLDDSASSDLVLSRLETPTEPASSMALEVIEELQAQLPEPA